MISQLISGSRFPVGSSAMIRRGSWTSARAIAVRCCSPPESVAGSWSAWALRPTTREGAIDGRPDLSARRPGHLQRERDVLADRPGREQLEVLEDDPDLCGAARGPCAAGRGRGPARRRTTSPARGQLVADEQLEERRLAGARRPDEEDELPSAEGQVDVAQGDLAVGVGLADAAQGHDGTRGLRAAPGAGRRGPGSGVGGRPEEVVRSSRSGRGYHRAADPSGRVRRRAPRRRRGATGRRA